MAEDRNRGPPPRHEQLSDSQYPPIPGEEDERSRAIPYRPRAHMASGSITLPSIQDPSGAYGPSGGRAWDPRAASYGQSPSSTNGYPPPPSSAHALPGTSYTPPGGSSAYPPPTPGSTHPPYLPPVQAHAQDPRVNYSTDPRAQQYYPGQRPPSYSGSGQYDYAYRPERGPPGAYPPEFARAGPSGSSVMQQSAPRQRTSIACRYCRRRKIRCSGYQNSPGGKCTNCIKMNQECIFQPVSSTASTAFVPVSALPNGIPPGVQLFGAYGQPLGTPGGGFQTTASPYDQPIPSPTSSYGPFSEDRAETGRRRQRTSEDEHGIRLPPPSTFPEDNSRRRSPSSSSPNHLQPYQQIPAQPLPIHGFDSRTPPPRGSPSGPAAGSSASSVMSLENIMGSGPSGNDIDQNMLGRLNRRT